MWRVPNRLKPALQTEKLTATLNRTLMSTAGTDARLACFLPSDDKTCFHVDPAAANLLHLRSLDLLLFTSGILSHGEPGLLAGADDEGARAVQRCQRNLRAVRRFDHCYHGFLDAAF